MKETVITVGDQVPIFGVLTEPTEDAVNENSPTVLIVNAGLLGRIGPFRLHVIFARELAKKGIRAVRLDLSGIGDSGRHKDSRPREEQHVRDIRDTLDYLEDRLGVSNFVVAGICTGADNAHRTMLEDKRVVGAVCVDGYAYPTLRYYINLYLGKAVSLKSWRSLFRKVFRRFEQTNWNEYASATDTQLQYRWSLPPKKQIEADYRKFLRRDARMLCIYTSGWPYNYTGQLADAFSSLDFGATISAVYLPNATHTFKVEDDRNSLINEVISWLKSNWGRA